MRKMLMMAAMVAGVQGAQAADMPALRGGYSDVGVSRPMWDGFYIGGQAAQSWMKIKPEGSSNADIEAAYTLRTGLAPSSIGLLPYAEGRKAAYGGFVGYNSQFEDVVIGFEANYLHSNLTATSIAYSPANDPIRAQTSTTVALTDYGSLRLRGGYMVGNFLPYAFVGFGAGSADVTRSAGVTSNAGVPVTFPFETVRKNMFVYGYSAGVGIDVLLIGGLFARGEYEYTQFTSKPNTSVNTVKVGLGYKF